jgi:hypothetical protein
MPTNADDTNEPSRLERWGAELRDDPVYYLSLGLPVIAALILLADLLGVLSLSIASTTAITGFIVGHFVSGSYWTWRISHDIHPRQREMVYTGLVGFELWSGAMEELEEVGDGATERAYQRGTERAKAAVREQGLAEGMDIEAEFGFMDDEGNPVSTEEVFGDRKE